MGNSVLEAVTILNTNVVVMNVTIICIAFPIGKTQTLETLHNSLALPFDLVYTLNVEIWAFAQIVEECCHVQRND